MAEIILLSLLVLVGGVMFVNHYSEELNDIKSKPVRILAKFSVLFAWPLWGLCAFLWATWDILGSLVKELFR